MEKRKENLRKTVKIKIIVVFRKITLMFWKDIFQGVLKKTAFNFCVNGIITNIFRGMRTTAGDCTLLS